MCGRCTDGASSLESSRTAMTPRPAPSYIHTYIPSGQPLFPDESRKLVSDIAWDLTLFLTHHVGEHQSNSVYMVMLAFHPHPNRYPTLLVSPMIELHTSSYKDSSTPRRGGTSQERCLSGFLCGGKSLFSFSFHPVSGM